MRPRGFEPLAYSFGDCRSIQLSYGRTFEKVITTSVRFPIAVLAAIVLFATTTAQKAGIRQWSIRRAPQRPVEIDRSRRANPEVNNKAIDVVGRECSSSDW